MSTMRMLSGAPVTQSTAAVVSLLKCLGKPINPLPDAVELPGMVLVLAKKKDVYYATTEKSCSCPSANYRPGQLCKHRRYYPGIGAAKDVDSIRPSGKWPGGFNGPVEGECIKAKTEPNKMEA